jgi:hypothetical protein
VYGWFAALSSFFFMFLSFRVSDNDLSLGFFVIVPRGFLLLFHAQKSVFIV